MSAEHGESVGTPCFRFHLVRFACMAFSDEAPEAAPRAAGGDGDVAAPARQDLLAAGYPQGSHRRRLQLQPQRRHQVEGKRGHPTYSTYFNRDAKSTYVGQQCRSTTTITIICHVIKPKLM
jgi:hypothetical protein